MFRCARSTERAGLIAVFDSRMNAMNSATSGIVPKSCSIRSSAEDCALPSRKKIRKAWRRPSIACDGKPAQPQSDHVQAGHAVLTLLEDERRDVFGRRAHAAQHRQPADPDSLLNRGVARKDAAVAQRHVPGNQGVVHDGAAVADPNVVPEMAADHEHVAVADPGHSTALDGASVHGDKLAEHVVVADSE